ncbi:HK97 gp10 family phage protein [Streptomyces sp. NPDC015130]|uniref:HK97 gp10 family phage protein n=1 Tax=Streptomyces sp. NPDC015130 TaxID=3364940 RepID=UPI0036F9C48C
MTPDEFADRLDAAADRLPDTIADGVRHTAMVGIGRIRANASGRPGPNVITGVYRSSWQAEGRRIPYGAECTIGTRQPQGRRLEFGFHGYDSLGRFYDQPPFPHVGPAIPVMEGVLKDRMRHAVEEAFA